MRPLKLELQAFGPYVEKQTVDFEKLSQNGIFLIKGNTGSGKTTIFDAMMVALYGGGSGENDKAKTPRNDLEEWRCTQCEAKAETFVSFTFSVRNRKYVFTRKLVPKTKNLSAQYEAGEIDEEGNVIPFFNNPKKDELTNKAEELIGLNKEQFRQVILLPQGQFERFLIASSDEKEKILQKIFDSGRWEKYAQKFYENASGRKSALDAVKSEIIRSLTEEKLNSIEELDETIKGLKAEKEAAEKAHILFNGELRQQELNRDRALAENFKPLHELEKKYRELCEREGEYKEKQLRYEEAEKAESLRGPITEYENAKDALRSRRNQQEELEQKLPEAKQAAESAKKKKEEHDLLSPADELNQKIGSFENKKSVYNDVKKFSEAYSDADRKWRNAGKEAEEQEKAFDKAVVSAREKLESCNEAEETARSYRNRYFTGIYGEIASELSEGEKCPVCGSVSHPSPAPKHPESVSKTEADAKEKEAADLRKLWDTAEKKREEAEKLKNEKKEALSKASAEKDAAEAALNTAKAGLIEGIPDIKSLEAAIAGMQQKISEYAQQTKRLQEECDRTARVYNDLSAKLETAKTETENAGKAAEEKKELLDSALSLKGYPDPESVKAQLMDQKDRTELQRLIVEYETECRETLKNLKEKQEELKDQPEPDASKFDERQKAIDDERTIFSKQDGERGIRIGRLSEKSGKLSAQKKTYDSEILQAESDLSFARKLRGDSGIGLQRYVLAVMFNQVIGEANRMLSKVHGGRYYLFRSDDKGSGVKRGLELKVHDNRSPEKEGRSVGMLSGGEKFLVSLALSIGMSTVAQKSGVQIEALFIDEGFGTLDDSSIHDAMDVLDSVRKGNGMIGIISHVQLLEANIPTHLEVIKEESGSSIRIV